MTMSTRGTEKPNAMPTAEGNIVRIGNDLKERGQFAVKLTGISECPAEV